VQSGSRGEDTHLAHTDCPWTDLPYISIMLEEASPAMDVPAHPHQENSFPQRGMLGKPSGSRPNRPLIRGRLWQRQDTAVRRREAVGGGSGVSLVCRCLVCCHAVCSVVGASLLKPEAPFCQKKLGSEAEQQHGEHNDERIHRYCLPILACTPPYIFSTSLSPYYFRHTSQNGSSHIVTCSLRTQR
jgi:hypothetical protein